MRTSTRPAIVGRHDATLLGSSTTLRVVGGSFALDPASGELQLTSGGGVEPPLLLAGTDPATVPLTVVGAPGQAVDVFSVTTVPGAPLGPAVEISPLDTNLSGERQVSMFSATGRTVMATNSAGVEVAEGGGGIPGGISIHTNADTHGQNISIQTENHPDSTITLFCDLGAGVVIESNNGKTTVLGGAQGMLVGSAAWTSVQASSAIDVTLQTVHGFQTVSLIDNNVLTIQVADPARDPATVAAIVLEQGNLIVDGQPGAQRPSIALQCGQSAVGSGAVHIQDGNGLDIVRIIGAPWNQGPDAVGLLMSQGPAGTPATIQALGPADSSLQLLGSGVGNVLLGIAGHGPVLLSPGGVAWRLNVSDAGALQVVAA